MRKTFLIVGIALLLGGGGLWWLQAAPPAQPLVAAPTATPNLITVNTPTNVVFTVSIPDQTLNPASVNLLRVAADGSSTIVAQMVDNGQNGDQQPGDKVFTARLTLNEAQAGTFGFQVSAAFRGILRRSLSSVQQFAVLAPHNLPVVLPPDPGEAGKATLAGIDSDGDGVRDDIQRYIIFTYPQSESIRAALFQGAKAKQAFVIGGTRASADAVIQADICLEAVLGGVVLATPTRHALKAEFLNTRARTAAFLAADNTLGGTTSHGPLGSRPTFCQFDPSGLRN